MFDFLNEDASNAVSVDEFVNFGFLFNFREDAIKDIFKEFDLSGDQVRGIIMYSFPCYSRSTTYLSYSKNDKCNLIGFECVFLYSQLSFRITKSCLVC